MTSRYARLSTKIFAATTSGLLRSTDGGESWQRIGLDDIEAAFEKMHRGEVLRSVVVF